MELKQMYLIFLVVFLPFLSANQNGLVAPNVEKCENRPREFSINGRNYFYSGHYKATRGKEVGWLEARNICRKYCMDTMSIDSQQEFQMVENMLKDYLVGYIWTSGRVCDSGDACDEVDLSKWYWTHNNAQLGAVDRNPPGWQFNPWSPTGYFKKPQPDNAEFFVNGKNESCLAVLHNVYDDGVKFHDVACYHKKPFVCEDSEELLRLVDVE